MLISYLFSRGEFSSLSRAGGEPGLGGAGVVCCHCQDHGQSQVDHEDLQVSLVTLLHRPLPHLGGLQLLSQPGTGDTMGGVGVVCRIGQEVQLFPNKIVRKHVNCQNITKLNAKHLGRRKSEILSTITNLTLS